MWIQIDLPTEVNKKLLIYRLENDFVSREEAVVFILRKHLIENDTNEKQ